MSAIIRRYLERTPTSAQLAHRATGVMPGGDTRSAVHHPPYTLTIKSGIGPFLYDVDGNDYIDLASNFTSLVHGNAFPPVVQAIQEAAARGTAWPARSDAQIALAHELVTRVQLVERVRFTNSGTEANMLAVRMARHITGRHKVLMARYGYHGSSDELEAGFAGRDSAGVRLADFGDLDGFAAVLAGGDVAAVILEPVMGSAGVVSPPDGFLRGVADAAQEAGSLLVLDEVVTFRLARGGAQELEGVSPDLTTFGKVIGGGLPVGAVGGRHRHMDRLNPEAVGPIWHSGTFNGNPITMAAGTAALRHLTRGEIARINGYAQVLSAELSQCAADAGLPFSVRTAGSLLNFYFSEELPPASLARTDAELMRAFHLACLNHGVFFPSRGMLVTSTAMTDDLVTDAIERMRGALTDVQHERRVSLSLASRFGTQ